MNQNLAVNIVAFCTEIKPVVSNDYETPNILPFARSIELLVDVSVESERRLTNHPV